MCNKLGGTFAPKPTHGPHGMKECLPLILILRNRLHYALNSKEVTMIVKSRTIKIDGKIRTDTRYPVGFMDVLTIPKTKENYRLMYNVKRRFCLVPLTQEQAKFKLCKVEKRVLGTGAIPFIVTHDGRTIRYPHPEIKANDTIKLNLETGKIEDFVKFEVGNTAMMTGGNGMGRVGVIVKREVHPGSFEIVHIKDAKGNTFTTRLNNVFVIGKGTETLVNLPLDNGIKKPLIQQVNATLKKNKMQKMGQHNKSTKKEKKVIEKKVQQPRAEKKDDVVEEKVKGKFSGKKHQAVQKKAKGGKKVVPGRKVAGK